MAKKKKGYRELKKYRIANGDTNEFVVDFKKYADEFTKLLKKKYCFILGNGQKFFLKLEEGNFYHLLGFHKFTKTIFVQMIEQDAYSYNATNFYNDVMNENIKFDCWIKSFWDYFIEEFNWIESDIEPVKLKKIYADWKNK